MDLMVLRPLVLTCFLIGWNTDRISGVAVGDTRLCPNNWEKNALIGPFGTCFRAFEINANWTEARSLCRRHDAFLVDIRKNPSSGYYQVYTAELGSNETATAEFWTGLHVHPKIGRLIRDEFTPFTVNSSTLPASSFFDWGSQQPDITIGRCVKVKVTLRSVKYYLENCSNSYKVICQRETIKPQAENGSCLFVDWYGGRFIDNCYNFNQSALTYVQARDRCQNIPVGPNVHLVKPTSPLLEAYISDMVQNVERGELGYWVGLRYNTSAREFTWVDGTPLNRNEISSQANAALETRSEGRDCTKIRFNRVTEVPNLISLSWSVVNCGDFGYSICEFVKTPVEYSKPILELNTTEGKVTGTFETNSELDFQLSNLYSDQKPVFMKNWQEYRTNSTAYELQGFYWYNVWKLHPLQQIPSNRILVINKSYLTFRCQVDIAMLYELSPFEINKFNLFGELDTGVEYVTNEFRTSIAQEISSLTGWNKVILNVKRFRYRVFSSIFAQFDVYVELDGGRRLEASGLTNLTNAMKTVLQRRAVEVLSQDQLQQIMDSMIILPTRNCPEVVSEAYNLPLGTAGQNHSSSIFCVNFEKPSYQAQCVGDFYDGLRWEISMMKGCETTLDSTSTRRSSSSNPSVASTTQPTTSEPTRSTAAQTESPTQPSISQTLDDINKMEINAENAYEIARSVATISRNTSDLVPDVINKITGILERIVGQESVDIESGGMVCMTVDNMMKADPDSLNEAQQTDSTSTRLLRTLDRYTERANLGVKKTERQAYRTFAVDIWNVDQGTQVNGIRFRQVTGPPLGTDNFNWFTNQTLESESSDDDDDDDDDNVEGIEVAIYLPPTLIQQKLGATPNGQKLRMSFIVQRLSVLFSVHPSDNSTETLESTIVSATLGREEIKDLPEGQRIRTVFFINQTEKQGTPRCVYWNFSMNSNQGGWSDKGCVLLNSTGKDGYFQCECDHLTNFAVLMDYGGKLDDANNKALTIITIIGLSLSIIGLSLTVITFIIFKKLRAGKHQKALFNLALALLIAWVVFLIGIILSQESLHNQVGCLITAVLLHYFILAGFMWMLVEGVLQYLSFVKVLDTYIPHFIKKAFFVAWGVPLIPVIAVLGRDYNLYYRHDSANVTKFCWMDQYTSYFAFLIPVGLIILVNLIVFCLVLWAICNRPKGLQTNQSKTRGTVISFQAGVACFILLGLTWIFGYLAIESARLPFQYIFTILNSFHGFFVFLIFTLRDKKVRQHWKELCCKDRTKKRNIYASSEMYSNSNKHGSESSSSNSTTNTVVSSNTRFKRIDSSGNSIKYEKEELAFMNNGYKT